MPQPTRVLLLTMSIPLWPPWAHLLIATPCHKAQILSCWLLEHDNKFTVPQWPLQSSDLNPRGQLWGVAERGILIMDVLPTDLQQLHDAIVSIWTKVSENYVTKSKGISEGKSGYQQGGWWMYMQVFTPYGRYHRIFLHRFLELHNCALDGPCSFVGLILKDSFSTSAVHICNCI